ncbi:MAG: hypothetical protein AUJ85_00885 [Elusimicrobia bacterium CG1_02_37_114]|nr:MAG: hypothetical protein AUJ85_00885 [Elusimicrobia bacterium CG1_02_37_114]
MPKKRIQLELIKFTICVFFVLLFVTAVNFYSFLSTMLPSSLILQSKARIIIFGLVTTVLIFGITWMLVQWFTYRTIGPIVRLEREIKSMVDSGDYRPLTVRKGDILQGLIEHFNLLIEKLIQKR